MSELDEIMAYYCSQGAPEDQQMLIALLREAQELCGGALTPETIGAIAETCGVKQGLLHALIRRIPTLRLAAAPHRLELCGSCAKGRALARMLEEAYGLQSGESSEKEGFSYHVTGCMKNCKNGPSIRWNGRLFGNADFSLIQSLIRGKE